LTLARNHVSEHDAVSEHSLLRWNDVDFARRKEPDKAKKATAAGIGGAMGRLVLSLGRNCSAVAR